MIRPNANEIPSRSAPVMAGVLSPASTSVATTEPGPTRTSSAVPSASARARCPSEYESILSLLNGFGCGSTVVESLSGTYSSDVRVSGTRERGGDRRAAVAQHRLAMRDQHELDRQVEQRPQAFAQLGEAGLAVAQPGLRAHAHAARAVAQQPV